MQVNKLYHPKIYTIKNQKQNLKDNHLINQHSKNMMLKHKNNHNLNINLKIQNFKDKVTTKQ
jgi:hypothetical protein